MVLLSPYIVATYNKIVPIQAINKWKPIIDYIILFYYHQIFSFTFILASSPSKKPSSFLQWMF